VIRNGQALLDAKRLHAHRCPAGGFTLLETIVVLFLLSLVLGLAAVHFAGRIPSAKLDATARELLATMKYANSLARQHHGEKTVAVDLDKKMFGIDGMAARNVPSEIGMKIVDPYDGEIVTGRHDFVFHASGGVDGSTIVLWNETRMRSIHPDPIVGAAIRNE
jgi:type II secretory pathway pseudopilin PulG